MKIYRQGEIASENLKDVIDKMSTNAIEHREILIHVYEHGEEIDRMQFNEIKRDVILKDEVVSITRNFRLWKESECESEEEKESFIKRIRVFIYKLWGF